MKRHGNLYPRVIDKENLLKAHRNARKGKRYYQDVIRVDRNEKAYIDRLHRLLADKTFTTAPYEVFRITEPKERLISKLPYFPDRIVHHAVMQVCQPIWDKMFIYDTYAATPGKGIHAGMARLRHFLKDRSQTTYCLKMDIAQFYPSVKHDILMSIIRRKIKCPDTLWLLEDVVRSVPGGIGLPIGNYLSQYLSNIYLDPFDHWIKEVLHLKYYLRYCDDAVVLHHDKVYLHDVWRQIAEYLEEQLRLKLNQKTQLFPVVARGIDFLGYKTYHGFSLLRKSAKQNLAAKVREIENCADSLSPQHVVSSVMSYMGWLKHCNAYHLTSRYILKNQAVLDAMTTASRQLNINNPLDQYMEGNYATIRR